MAWPVKDAAELFVIPTTFGAIWGALWSITTIPVLEGGDLRRASLTALLPSIGVSMALGAFSTRPLISPGFHLLISVAMVTTLFEVLCAQSSKRVRAWRDRDPWRGSTSSMAAMAQCLP